MRKILQILHKIDLLKRIVPSLLKIFIKFFKSNEVIIKNNEVLFNLNLMNPIDREIYLKGDYEKQQIDFLSEQITKHKINFFLQAQKSILKYSFLTY